MTTTRFLGVFLFLCTSAISREALASPVSRFGGYDEDCSRSPSGDLVWPTVKARPEYVQHQLTYRLIQINWKVAEVQDGDLVAVFEDLPEANHLIVIPPHLYNTSSENSSHATEWDSALDLYFNISQPENYYWISEPLFVATPYATEGTVTTSLSHSRPSVSQLTRGGCVGHWVAYLRNMKVLAARCISSNPKWMWDNRSVLGDRPLRSLVIPGTHNSGSYSLLEADDPVSTWVVCQDEKVLTQLLLGVRYLDLRIGYYPETKELLWINHDKVRWLPLQEVLSDIRAFCFLSPDPVIIDIHRTPAGFDHEEASWLLISLINSTLGDYLAPSSIGPNVSPGDLWKNGNTIILSYGPKWMRTQIPWLWPPIFQAWADVQNLDDLKRYLNDQMAIQRDEIWAAMGQMTASVWDFIFNIGAGVRGFSDKVGRPLTDWLNEKWSQTANIIALDFPLSNDVIYNSIRLSILRQRCFGSNPDTAKTVIQRPFFISKNDISQSKRSP